MIGNDIVDIRTAYDEGSWKRKGFVDKVFTDSELIQIGAFGNPFNGIWRMWSMKESVYKVIIQAGEERFLNSRKLVCTIKNDEQGAVFYKGKSYATHSLITDRYIYSSHTADENAEIIDEIIMIRNRGEQSQMTRLSLLQRVANMFKYPIQKLSIRKNKLGVPKLYNAEEEMGLKFSLTHHGRYGAYAIQKMLSTRNS